MWTVTAKNSFRHAKPWGLTFRNGFLTYEANGEEHDRLRHLGQGHYGGDRCYRHGQHHRGANPAGGAPAGGAGRGDSNGPRRNGPAQGGGAGRAPRR